MRLFNDRGSRKGSKIWVDGSKRESELKSDSGGQSRPETPRETTSAWTEENALDLKPKPKDLFLSLSLPE